MTALFLWGCETPARSTSEDIAAASPPAHAGAKYPAIQYREHMKLLRVGMSADEVLALVSEPIARIPAQHDAKGLERWVYELRHRPQFRTVVAEMEEIPVVDPINGVAGVVLEAREGTERFQLIETFTLGFDDQNILTDLDYTSERQRT